ncbi:PAAR domain-containing protein, partial [Yersinia pestis]
MAKGYYLGVGDETTCGGVIIEGDATHVLMGKAVAREQDRVTCGKHPGTYIIIGHVPGDSVNGRKFAGTLNSQSNCPCKAWFIPSLVHDTYEFGARSKSQNMSEISTEVEREMVENVSESEEKSKVVCAHIDGALVVASYILDEIKKNVK